MAKMGRPRIEIDWDDFERLCKMLCTAEEIAGYFSCSTDTLSRAVKSKYGKTFADIYKSYNAHGKVALRRSMMQMALKQDRNSVPILIYLDRKHTYEDTPGAGDFTPPANDGQIKVVDNKPIDPSISTVELLERVLARPKMVTDGSNDE